MSFSWSLCQSFSIFRLRTHLVFLVVVADQLAGLLFSSRQSFLVWSSSPCNTRGQTKMAFFFLFNLMLKYSLSCNDTDGMFFGIVSVPLPIVLYHLEELHTVSSPSVYFETHAHTDLLASDKQPYKPCKPGHSRAHGRKYCSFQRRLHGQLPKPGTKSGLVCKEQATCSASHKGS